MKLNSITKMTAALALGLGLTVSAHAEDVIKVGVLHSLSGTMAISETTLKDTVQMLVDEMIPLPCASGFAAAGRFGMLNPFGSLALGGE